MAKLLDVCDVQYGFPFDSSLFSDSQGVPVIRIRDVKRGYSETYTTESYKAEYLVHKNDILIGMDGEFNIARWGETPALLNQRVCRLFPSDSIDNNYLFYFMQKALKEIEARTPFATVKHLSAKEINRLEFPAIDLKIQQDRGTILAKIDYLVFIHEQQLAKLDELVKARFVEMFGDPEFNTKNLSVVCLGDVCEVGSSKRIYQSEQSITGIPFLRISDLVTLMDTGELKAKLYISESRYIELRTHGLVPNPEDILVTSRGTLGRCYIVQDTDCFYFQDGMISWLSKFSSKVMPRYIKHLFTMNGFRRQIDTLQEGTTVAYLSISMLKKLKIMLPPLALQKQFADFVQTTEKSKLTIQASLDKLEILKKSLMQKYFG